MRKTLLLIAQPDSYRIAPYLKAANNMGIEVMIASRGKYSLVTEVHQGLHVDLDNIETASAQILATARNISFSGILGSDDSTVELAATVAHKLGLPHNPPYSARLTCRKDLARAHLAETGCPVPLHFLLNLNKPLQHQLNQHQPPWPCVIKPINMSASRGVMRVNNATEMVTACERIKAIIATANDDFERTHILVEEYIEGTEVAYEGYLNQGELTTLAIFDKPDPLTGPFFEETIYITPSRLSQKQQNRITQRVEQAARAYGLTTGPVHAELRVNAQDAWILEVASRSIGGDCARTLDNGTAFNLEKLIISLATANPVDMVMAEDARGVMMIPIPQAGILKRVEGLSTARKVEHIEKVDIIAREGHELIPLPEGNQYPGYIFAQAPTPTEVINALRTAHTHLNFIVAPVFKIQPS